MKALDPAFSWDATRGAILANGTMATIHSTEGRHQEAHALAVESLGLAERLVALRPADTQARESVARAAFFVALTFKQGDSVPLWRQAGTHYEALLKEAPDDPARMRNVALVEKYLGGEIDRQDRDDEALVHYRRALELDERILAQNPDDRQALFDVAIDLGNIAAATRDSQARLPVLVRSLAIRERLAKLDPADEYARGRLARTHRDLALAHLQLGDLGSADTHTAAAEQGYRLLAGTGAHQGLTQERAELFQVAGDVARARGHHEAACARYRESVSEWRRLPAPPAGSATNRWRQSAEKSAAACQ
jgi:tetratricopeptide (TPR) repeat protein